MQPGIYTHLTPSVKSRKSEKLTVSYKPKSAPSETDPTTKIAEKNKKNREAADFIAKWQTKIKAFVETVSNFKSGKLQPNIKAEIKQELKKAREKCKSQQAELTEEDLAKLIPDTFTILTAEGKQAVTALLQEFSKAEQSDKHEDFAFLAEYATTRTGAVSIQGADKIEQEDRFKHGELDSEHFEQAAELFSDSDWREVLKTYFADLQSLTQEIKGGSTATTVIAVGPKIYTAHLGNSPAFVHAIDKKGNVTQLEQLTKELHEAGSPGEQKRLEEAGFKRFILKKGKKFRLQKLAHDPHDEDEKATLENTRALGDNVSEACGLSHDPDIRCYDASKMKQSADGRVCVSLVTDFFEFDLQQDKGRKRFEEKLKKQHKQIKRATDETEEAFSARYNAQLAKCYVEKSYARTCAKGKKVDNATAVVSDLEFDPKNKNAKQNKKIRFFSLFDGHAGSAVSDACYAQCDVILTRVISEKLQKVKDEQSQYQLKYETEIARLNSLSYPGDLGKIGKEIAQAMQEQWKTAEEKNVVGDREKANALKGALIESIKVTEKYFPSNYNDLKKVYQQQDFITEAKATIQEARKKHCSVIKDPRDREGTIKFWKVVDTALYRVCQFLTYSGVGCILTLGLSYFGLKQYEKYQKNHQDQPKLGHYLLTHRTKSGKVDRKRMETIEKGLEQLQKQKVKNEQTTLKKNTLKSSANIQSSCASEAKVESEPVSPPLLTVS